MRECVAAAASAAATLCARMGGLQWHVRVSPVLQSDVCRHSLAVACAAAAAAAAAAKVLPKLWAELLMVEQHLLPCRQLNRRPKCCISLRTAA